MKSNPLSRHRVVPVLTTSKETDAVLAAKALLGAGVSVIEITLRNSRALDVLRAVHGEVPEILAGAGSVRTPEQFDSAADAGAGFAVSPGCTKTLMEAGKHHEIPLIPGVATPSDIMSALDYDYQLLKLFPVTLLGGVAIVRALAGPFPEARFFVTGGVHAGNFASYLVEPNVACVGGTWILDQNLLASGDLASIDVVP